jgi:erythronate-4-phosphate dehydrogenase
MPENDAGPGGRVSLTILADENIPAAEYYFAPLGEVRHTNGRNLQRAELVGIDVLLVRSVTRVDESLLAGSAVRFVGTATSGVDHIDRDYLARNSIGFSHAPGSNANSVVEYVLAAIAAVEDKLERLLAGGRVGVVGYGVIGKMLVSRLAALGIDYCVFDPWLAAGVVSHPATLAEVLACDVITLHPELTLEQPWPSFHLLSQAELECVDANALLINASRGPVVDNASLLARLEKARSLCTVLDVWEGEPNIDTALLDLATLGSAHIAGYSLDGKLLATRMLRDALAAYLQHPPIDQVSPAGEPPVITIEAGLNGAALLRFLLQSRYDITEDDSLLRETALGNVSGVAGDGFDRLRKTYGERRELLGSQVVGKLHSAADSALVHGLGCTLTAEEITP